MTTMKLAAPASPARTGVWIGIATISMSFTAYTSAMVVRQGSGADWHHLVLPNILYLNTLILLVSSVTLEAAHRRIMAGRSGTALLATTLGLGVLFLAGQLLAWRDLAAQGLYLATGPASAFFYVFTALHGLHLLGGLLALAYVLARLRSATEGPPLPALGAARLYWHFMGVLWLYLLVVLASRP